MVPTMTTDRSRPIDLFGPPSVVNDQEPGENSRLLHPIWSFSLGEVRHTTRLCMAKRKEFSIQNIFIMIETNAADLLSNSYEGGDNFKPLGPTGTMVNCK